MSNRFFPVGNGAGLGGEVDAEFADLAGTVEIGDGVAFLFDLLKGGVG